MTSSLNNTEKKPSIKHPRKRQFQFWVDLDDLAENFLIKNLFFASFKKRIVRFKLSCSLFQQRIYLLPPESELLAISACKYSLRHTISTQTARQTTQKNEAFF